MENNKTSKKFSEKQEKYFAKLRGKPAPWLQSEQRDEIKKRISLKKKGIPSPKQAGENSYNWKGGVTWSVKNQEKLAGRPKPDQCELCGAIGGRINFDHDHTTNKFRGWICLRCNVALGMVKDNTGILQAMIDYINNSKNNG